MIFLVLHRTQVSLTPGAYHWLLCLYEQAQNKLGTSAVTHSIPNLFAEGGSTTLWPACLKSRPHLPAGKPLSGAPQPLLSLNIHSLGALVHRVSWKDQIKSEPRENESYYQKGRKRVSVPKTEFLVFVAPFLPNLSPHFER